MSEASELDDAKATASGCSTLLLDVSRLIWRVWRGGLPTGIDRVCLAYLDHYRSRSLAVVHFKSGHYVLPPLESDRLFDLLSGNSARFRLAFLRFALTAFARARPSPSREGMVYLNIGHTGLNDKALAGWIWRNHLRAVYFIHDLIPLLHPEYCRADEQARHERRMINALSSATAVIGNSQATLDDLAIFARERGLPFPPSLAAWIAGPPAAGQVQPKTFERPHFAIVGTIEGRKNHRLLLHIWQRLASTYGERTPLLVIVGQRGWKADEAVALLDRAEELKGNVLELGHCGDEEMASIIAGARALLMPSFAEGFGLPVAEALELGTPVIASDLPVFREFAGDIPTYLDPLDGRAWEARILEFMGNSPERERQLDAMKTFRAPSWSDHFARVDEWLETL